MAENQSYLKIDYVTRKEKSIDYIDRASVLLNSINDKINNIILEGKYIDYEKNRIDENILEWIGNIQKNINKLDKSDHIYIDSKYNIKDLIERIVNLEKHIFIHNVNKFENDIDNLLLDRERVLKQEEKHKVENLYKKYIMNSSELISDNVYKKYIKLYKINQFDILIEDIPKALTELDNAMKSDSIIPSDYEIKWKEKYKYLDSISKVYKYNSSMKECQLLLAKFKKYSKSIKERIVEHNIKIFKDMMLKVSLNANDLELKDKVKSGYTNYIIKDKVLYEKNREYNIIIEYYNEIMINENDKTLVLPSIKKVTIELKEILKEENLDFRLTKLKNWYEEHKYIKTYEIHNLIINKHTIKVIEFIDLLGHNNKSIYSLKDNIKVLYECIARDFNLEEFITNKNIEEAKEKFKAINVYLSQYSKVIDDIYSPLKITSLKNTNQIEEIVDRKNKKFLEFKLQTVFDDVKNSEETSSIKDIVFYYDKVFIIKDYIKKSEYNGIEYNIFKVIDSIYKIYKYNYKITDSIELVYKNCLIIKKIFKLDYVLEYTKINQIIVEYKNIEKLEKQILDLPELLYQDKKKYEEIKSCIPYLEKVKTIKDIEKYYYLDVVPKIIMKKVYGDINKFKYTNKYKEYIDKYNMHIILKKQCLEYEIKKLRNRIANENILEQVIKCIKDEVSKIEHIINDYNNKYIIEETDKYSYIFDNIEGNRLDNQQKASIIKNAYNNLIVAGAGSGKTTTILGYVKYLLEKYPSLEDDILVISFTKNSSRELKDRINRMTNNNIDVLNFHQLGLKIINEVLEDNKYKALSERHNRILKIVYDLIEDKHFKDKISVYILEYYKYYLSNGDFESKEAYDRYYKEQEKLRYTIKGEIVKSFEEKKIANFLHLYGVKYEYEKPYEYNTSNEIYKKQYEPDFYLTDYGIYIEHFGIDENEEPPSFYSEGERIRYKESMDWKRKIHKENKTKLIETYSWENKNKELLINLSQKLKEHGIKLENKIKYKNTRLMGEFIDLIERIITIIKIKSIDVKELRENLRNKYINDNSIDNTKNIKLIDIVDQVHDEYEKKLKHNQEIDYSDMIKKATEYIKQNKYHKRYKYIIIDEYQDISEDRLELIKEIRKLGNSKLFCVGDDWQSIYGFSGSKIEFFTNFENYFGPSEMNKIETTYRFGDEIINVSNKFITKNPEQIKKSLIPYKQKNSNINIYYYDNYCEEEALKKILDSIPRKSTVLILGRYNYDILEFCGEYIRFKNNNIYFNGRQDLNIEYKNIHKSKGLQYDYIILLNNNTGIYGFPSKMKEEPLVELLLSRNENYPYEEERRLFYVAITRAKEKVYLLSKDGMESEFIQEIIGEFDLNKIKIEKQYKEGENCPKCKKGSLKLRNGPYSKFYGCSSYPRCKFNSINEVKHKQNNKKNIQRCIKCNSEEIYYKSGIFGLVKMCNKCKYIEIK